MAGEVVIVADFIGGPWDGKEYSIPYAPEFRVAIMKELHWLGDLWASRDKTPKPAYDIAVYRHIVNGIYWLSRIEVNE